MTASELLDKWCREFYVKNDCVTGWCVAMPGQLSVMYFDAHGTVCDERDAFVGTKCEATCLMTSPFMEDVFPWTRLVPVHKYAFFSHFADKRGVDIWMSFPTQPIVT